MALASGEVSERHPVSAADCGLQMVDLSGKSIRRKPLGHCIGIEERSIDRFRFRTEYAMEPDRVAAHDDFSCCDTSLNYVGSGPVSLTPTPPRRFAFGPTDCDQQAAEEHQICH